MIDHGLVHEGMLVRSADGKKLGRVLACEESEFIVEKGFFFTTDYVARFDDVAEVEDDEVHLARPEEDLWHTEHTEVHECGLGESITVGLGSGTPLQ